MAKNPMQKKAQTSFLLGMLITLVITGAIIAILFLKLKDTREEVTALQEARVKVCAVNKDIKSGQVITDDMITVLEINKDTLPSNSFGSDVGNISTYRLEDSRGNTVTTNEDGQLCLPQLNEAGEIVTDASGNPRQRIIDTPDGENYYYQDSGEKVELVTSPIVAKIALSKNTVLTSSAVSRSDEKTQNDIRKVEYNMILLPTQLESETYIDVRLRLPNGKDLIVTSHKQIEIPEIDGVESLNTMRLNLSETEILTLSCAIIESYKIPGSYLYAIEYIEPGMQEAAIPTYLPDDETINLIHRDPNCVETAKQAIFARNDNSDLKGAVRNPVNSELNANSEDAADNAVDKVQEEIDKMQEERQIYLESLGG